MIKTLFLAGCFAACGSVAWGWDGGARRVELRVQETNDLLRQANQEQRYQNYLQQVALYAEQYPDKPPPKPVLSPDPRDAMHNLFLLDRHVELTFAWEKEKDGSPVNRMEVEDLEAEFQKMIHKSRNKRDRVYPEALDPNHPIHAEAEKIWKNIEATNHPLLNDPDAPFKVYEMAALRLGIKPTGK